MPTTILSFIGGACVAVEAGVVVPGVAGVQALSKAATRKVTIMRLNKILFFNSSPLEKYFP